MEAKELSTRVTCEESWEVSVGKKNFTLTPKQFEVLKKAMEAGSRGVVFFDKFGISIPHISHTSLKRRDYYRLDGTLKLKIGRAEYERHSKLLLK